MFTVISIPTKFIKPINRLKDKERLYIFDSLLKIGSEQEITVSDDTIGDLICLIYGEWMAMQSKNGKKADKCYVTNITGNTPGNPAGNTPVEENRIEENRREYISCDSFSLEDTLQEMQRFIGVWNEWFDEKRIITDKFKEKYLVMRKKYSHEELNTALEGYYQAKKDVKDHKFKLDPLAFISQSNGIPKYL